MNPPDELILERFRCFSGSATLPLKPVTLVYGANNSGKSALLRALALFGSSLETANASALRLPERAFPKGRFQDLAWQGEAGSYAWNIGLRWPDAAVREVKYTLNGTSDSEPYISKLEIKNQDQGEMWRARANEDRQLVDPASGGPLAFLGLMPDKGVLPDLHAALSTLRGKVRWLAGVRQPVPRILQAGIPADVAQISDGTGTAELLGTDAALLDAVARFYAGLDPSRRLELHEAPPLGRWLSLNPSSQPAWRVHINDTGEGMAQVLPVIVHAELTAREGGLLAIEEPESHLHPIAQRMLADHLCSLTRKPTSPRFILETHSRVFLLAVQLAVASGYPADNVRIVWVDQLPSGRSTATVVRIRENGQLGDGWPSSALGEDLHLARALTRMARKPVENSE